MNSANTFFLQRKTWYSFPSNNLLYVQGSEEEIFTVTTYQEMGEPRQRKEVKLTFILFTNTSTEHVSAVNQSFLAWHFLK